LSKKQYNIFDDDCGYALVSTNYRKTHLNMSNILTCYNCHSKPCRQTPNGTFDICQYGVSFLNKDGNIETREPKIPLSTIAKNLRHEINPILQAIIEQASLLDPNLSIKTIYLDKPLSVIVGSTVILDNFIQMITGVHEFHSTPTNIAQNKFNLKNQIDFYFTVYSIVKEEGRAQNLRLNNIVTENYIVHQYSDFLKYILVILIDNAWKYSSDQSTITVNLKKNENGLFNLEIVNKSLRIPNKINIFNLGCKVDPESKGFGYGLYWIKTLESSYNTLTNAKIEDQLSVIHEQQVVDIQFAFQKFTVVNINLIKAE
jgi:hypothetical protein